MADKAYNILAYTLFGIPLSFNLFGIYCLHLQKRRKDNQKIILYSLSANEVISTIVFIVKITIELYPHIDRNVQKIFMAVFGGSQLIFYLIMVSLTLDRLVCVLLHMKYKFYVTNKIVCKVMYGCFLTGLAAVIPLYFAHDKLQKHNIFAHGFIICDSVVVFTAISTYAYIAFILHLQRKKLCHQKQRNTTLRKQHVVPALIISSYVLFYAIPDALMLITDFAEKEQLIVGFGWMIGLTLDPIIYIFFHEETRNVALTTLKCTLRIRQQRCFHLNIIRESKVRS